MAQAPPIAPVEETPSSFQNARAEERYRAAYEATLALWPIRPERMEVPTRLGMTHVNAVGSSDAPPVILLPAACASSTEWYEQVGALAQRNRVYALDTLGDAGLTRPSHAAHCGREFAEWCTEVLDALGIDRAPLVGHSYGGWIALNTALFAPSRVLRLALLAPAASFAPLSVGFWAHFAALVILRNPLAGREFVRWATIKGHRPPAQFVEQFSLAPLAVRLRMGPPTVLKDAELRRITVPTLLLIGEEEVIYRSRTLAFESARRLLPNVEATWVPGASHFLTDEQPAFVNGRLTAFLDPSTW